jgi:UPF0042 nucleotide-binding protein
VSTFEPVTAYYDGDSGGTQVVITSFGYLHAAGPEAHVTLDLRDLLRDPHVSPAMREMTGLDAAVRASVLRQPGADTLLSTTAALATTLVHQLDPHSKIAFVAVGCAGGRHRSVVVANELANTLAAANFTVELIHRDILRPVVHRTTSDEEA